MVVPQGLTKFRTVRVSKLQNEQAKLTALSTEGFWQLYDEFLSLEKRLANNDEKLASMGRAPPACHRPQTIPGIGLISATAILAAVSDATPCKNGRQLSAWLGFVPREHSTAATALGVHASCTAPQPRSAGSTRSRRIGFGGSKRSSPDAAKTVRLSP